MALCDFDTEFAARTFRRYPKATRYSDYRRMLDRERDIDAVIIATPDHTHAVIAMAAMKRDTHVYCEKPLTRTVAEARVLATTAHERNVVTQMGNQGHAGDGTRQIARPSDAHHVPPGLDWDLFLGPAGMAPARLAIACHSMDAAFWALELEARESGAQLPGGNTGSRGHYREWIDACKGNGTTGSPTTPVR